MVRCCFILGCSRRKKSTKSHLSYYRIPAVLKSAGVLHVNGGICTLAALSKERQENWVKAINRGPLTTSQLKNSRICSQHFISGKPAELTDRNNPDWIPCKKLGYVSSVAEKKQAALDRHEKLLKRSQPGDKLITWENVSKESKEGELDQYTYGNNIFHFADATVKAEHSFSMKRPKLRTHSSGEESSELDEISDINTPKRGLSMTEEEIHSASEEPIELLKIPDHSPKTVLLPKKGKENLSSPSTSKNSPITSRIQNSKVNSPLENRGDFIDDERRNKLNELLARAIYKSASPMDMTENYHWKQFFRALRASYVPPTAFDLRSSLLDNEYKRVMATAQKRVLNAPFLVLATYGWSNPKGEIHFVVTTPEPVFCKCLLSKGEKTETFISQQIKEVIEKIGSQKLMLLMTDSGANMKEAWEIIAEAYPHISICGSGADDVKLLLKDIIKLNAVQEILQKAKEMILSINLTEADVKQNEDQVKSLVRWGAISTLKTLLENKSAFQVDIAPDEMIPEEVRQKILDEDKEFWIEVEKLLEVMNFISEGIQVLESSKALLSDVPNIFTGIQAKILTWIKNCPLLSDKEKNDICCFISIREESAIKPIHFAANLLDPRFRGEDLSNEEIESAIDFLRQRCEHLGYNEESVLLNLENYRTSKGSFSRTFLWGTAKHISPVEWWQNFCATQSLFRLAVQLLSVPPSPILYQRIFKGIEMNPRHGLDSKGLEKLIIIKSNLIMSRDLKKEDLDSILLT